MNLSRLSSGILSVLATLFVFSCSPAAPKQAVDETKHKKHDDPSAVVFRLTKANLANPEKWNDSPTLKDITLTDEVQEMHLSLTRKGFLADGEKGLKEWKVKSTVTEPNTVYLLEIFYKDAQDKLMNGQFIENGQDLIHQHFFRRYAEYVSPEDGIKRVYPVPNADELGFDYRYADVSPWNKPYTDPASMFTGNTNPMGFKGLIRFTEEDIRFHITILLMHAHEPKARFDKAKKVQIFMPFYNNDAFRINQEADISLDVAVSVDKATKDQRIERLRK
jgi:putative lipoprotein